MGGLYASAERRVQVKKITSSLPTYDVGRPNNCISYHHCYLGESCCFETKESCRWKRRWETTVHSTRQKHAHIVYCVIVWVRVLSVTLHETNERQCANTCQSVICEWRASIHATWEVIIDWAIVTHVNVACTALPATRQYVGLKMKLEPQRLSCMGVGRGGAGPRVKVRGHCMLDPFTFWYLSVDTYVALL